MVIILTPKKCTMKKILLLCLLTVSMFLSAQITLGGGSNAVGQVPIDNFSGYSYSQQIFKKEEINANAAGNITGLKFYLDPATDISNSSDWIVYLGHTSKTAFASGDDWISVSNLTEVYAGVVSNVNGIVELTFSTPFPYNNTQNLVIAVDENASGGDYGDDYAFNVHNLNNAKKSAISTGSYFVDSDPSDPDEGDLLDYRSVVSFIGLTPKTLPSCTNLMYPMNNAVLIPATPAISWYESSGATGYKISIGTTPGGSDIVNQQTVSTTSFTPLTPLALNTTYYVRIISVGAGGESSGCFETKFTTTPPPPSNDECANATNLTVSPTMSCVAGTAGSTLAATNSNLDPDPCYGVPDDDVWYKFTATESGHIISLTNVTSVGSEQSDSVDFQVFSGDCNGLTSIICSPYSGVGVLEGLTVGETYYVRVYSSNEGGEFAQSFNICVGTLPPPPANDDCSAAVTLTVNPDMNCGSKTFGHTRGASDSNIPVSPCYGEVDDDVWYKFTATSTTHAVSLSNTISIGSEDSYSLLFQVLSGDCSNLAHVECSDYYGDMTVISGLTVGQTYYVRVYTDGGAGEAQSFDICIGTLPPPPVNDDCSGALTASTFPYTYTQSDAAGATNNNGFIQICSNAMNDGTWFKFTGDGTVHNIKVSMPEGSSFDAQIGVFSGACDGLTCESTIDTNGAGDAETISVPTVLGTTYYVNVGHYSGTTDNLEGTFTIAINKQTLATSEVSKAKNEIKVYPNPFVEVLNIAKADLVKSISVMDVSGRLVKTIESPSSVLHLGELKQGIYIVVLNMKDGTKQTVKAIKK